MSYTVFARKYRPQTFADVVGQEHITRTLQNAIEQNRLAHAYLFVGPRGTGKTSTARILAMALNCSNGPRVDFDPNEEVCREIAEGRSMDVLEFDAASNTQVDKIREIIIDNVKYAPTRGKYKVYIVDEVHMLSASSFNALLKTLEEPPAHVKFVFATTDVQKVPTTILSRCQRFDLKRIPTPLIRDHLLMIAKKEGLELAPVAAEAIAHGAEGGMRDAESMLDQLVAFCGAAISQEDVLNVFGFTAQETVSTLCDHMISGDAPTALAVVHEQAGAGKDLSRLLSDLIGHCRNLLVAKADPEGLAEDLSPGQTAALVAQAGRLPMDRLLDLIEQFAAAETRMKWAPNKRMHLEVAVIRAVQTLSQATLNEVLETLTALRGGTPLPPPSGNAAPRPLPRPAPKTEPAPKAAPAPAPKAELRPTPTPTPAPKPAPRPAAEATPSVRETPAEAKPEPASAPAPAVSEPELWPAALAAIRKEGHSLRLWAPVGTLLRVEGDVAVIGFPGDQALASSHCSEKENRAYLAGLLSRLAGRPLKVEVESKEGLEVTPVPIERPETKTAAAPADPMEEFKNDPLIAKALELFKAQIQPA